MQRTNQKSWPEVDHGSTQPTGSYNLISFSPAESENTQRSLEFFVNLSRLRFCWSGQGITVKVLQWLFSLQVEAARGTCHAHLPCKRGGSHQEKWAHAALPQLPIVGSPSTPRLKWLYPDSSRPEIKAILGTGYFLFTGLQNILN